MPADEIVWHLDLTHMNRLRSYLGFPPIRDALPNTTHVSLAALQHASVISQLITQNVDGLHLKALARIWSPSRIQEQILELHGTLHVHMFTNCLRLTI